MKQPILTLLSFLLLQSVLGQEKQALEKNIPVIFNEIKTETKKSYSLWNKDLYGPILLVDTKTRQVFANESDTAGILKQNEDLFTGTLPDPINIANTAMRFAGKSWAMIMLPLPQNKEDRNNLLAHELFHTIQPSLGFTLNNPENNHLDRKDGRVYLRLELEALKKAVQSSSKNELHRHLASALTFRKYRHLCYNGADTTENLLEMNEGLAEFTGFIVSGRTKEQAKVHFVNGIDTFFTNPTFVRSFAYQTIPVYGYLLYGKNKNWNKEISPKTNLTNYFIKAFNINTSANLKAAVESLADSYNGKTILQEETAREEKAQKLIAEYKLRFIEQAHFTIKFEKMNVSFDPRNIIPIEDKGTVYPNIRVTDLWGVLTVEKGALMSANWDKISVTNPVKVEEKRIIGEGWTLELNEGYALEKDDSGNFKLKRE
ncbi:hypothetical protein [Pedobacter polysacchareus]|uniref:hypothetical protein n=1 Tax=Pedobacter polysacchareus TaxID=2861973 RepID=UPI001C9A1DD7|nr:hypothetical protein [Pedobacter polysacchareus]